MSRFSIADTPLAGLKVVTRQRLDDSRGFLSRLFCTEELTAAGWTKPIAQINHTYTARKGTVRGMHFQRPPHAEMKIVICLHGEVFDVAVDLRAGSPTFLQWHAVHLSTDNDRGLIIPEGFAHGFQSLTADCDLIYFHSEPFQPASEGALNIVDPRLAIQWPLEITEVSSRDFNHPLINGAFEGISV